MNENQGIRELKPNELDIVSGGLEGNLEVPEGYKRVCARCGSDRVYYWTGMGAPVCYDCMDAGEIITEYNIVPK